MRKKRDDLDDVIAQSEVMLAELKEMEEKSRLDRAIGAIWLPFLLLPFLFLTGALAGSGIAGLEILGMAGFVGLLVLCGAAALYAISYPFMAFWRLIADK